MDICAADFTDFFRSIHGDPPFPWQQRLVDRLAGADDEWPDVLDVPTGAGKTAALDAAVFHLALRADRPRKAALRIALVVDRRLIVDDAFARATKIAKALCRANRDGGEECETVREVARRLGRLAGANAPPLVAKRLRGGAPLEHDWARTPTQPTILCSTVDQVGSRLLFRGYGVSDRMKPVHAGLLGTNSLILLDEAHLSDPFRRTVDAVRELGRATVKLVVLSATPGVRGKRPLSLCEDDRVNPVLKARLEARKPAALSLVPENADAAAAFATAARCAADRLRSEGTSGFAIGIVVNRVRLAREIYNELAGGDEGFDALLMIGRSRSVRRDSLDAKLKPFRTGKSGRAEARPLFVVSTQCLEVGVDLDLDALVTQAAALDALRQRFGRLNRGGRDVSAQGAVLALASDIGKRSVDPVYGDRIPQTWEVLKRLADDGKVDFGIRAMDDSDIDVSSLATPMAKAPVVMPAYLDLWSHTSPRPTADPEVELFLHGSRTASTDVSIVWRSDIDQSIMQKQNEENLHDLIALVPPRAAEMVAVPLWTARSWLRASGAGQAGEISDAPAPHADLAEDNRALGIPIRERLAYRWAGPDDPRTELVLPGAVRPGDVLVVPASIGGCDEFGWSPDDGNPVKDVADDAAAPFRVSRAFARIARDAVGEDNALWSRIRAILADESMNEKDIIRQLLNALDRESDEPPDRDARKSLRELLCAKGQISIRRRLYVGESEGGAVLVAEQGVRTDGQEAGDSAAPATEDDRTSSKSAKPVSLDRHGCDVERIARNFAKRLQLPDEVVEDLCLAAFLHDAGKADSRFQTLLSGGDSWSLPSDKPLAKSQRSWGPGTWKQAGLPPGWRHEALSVRMARVHPRFREARNPALVLWLIGTHHGFGRPFYRFSEANGDAGGCNPFPCLDVVEWPIDSGDPGPQSMGFQFESMDWPELFERLKRRHGIWGLAHLEAVLRLADHRASAMDNRS